VGAGDISPRQERWTRDQKIALAALIVSVLALIVGFFTPEGRKFLHLDKSVAQSHAQTQSQTRQQSSGTTGQVVNGDKNNVENQSHTTIASHSTIKQQSTGDCSPNNIGSNNTLTLNCGSKQ